MSKSLYHKIAPFFIGLLLFSMEVRAQPLTIPTNRYGENWNQFKEHDGIPPFVCELGLRSLADHQIDPNREYFDPAAVKPGDIVYVAVWLLEWFIESAHEQIAHPYILVTCDVGSWLPTPGLARLLYDPKVVAWYAKNMMFTNHSKLFQLPMGQCIFLWINGFKEQLPYFANLVANAPHEKKHLLYLNHCERNHGRRIEIAEMFYDKPYCYSRNRTATRHIAMTTYWDEVAQSKFVISPLGLEVDCTRTWECFSLKSIPIVEHSYLDPLYEGLPILLIHDWREVNEEFLEKKYTELMNKEYNYEKIYLSYWETVLEKKKKQIQQGDFSPGWIESNGFSQRDLGDINFIINSINFGNVLIYCGHLSGPRPYQVANLPCVSAIALFDDWLSDPRMSNSFRKSVRDKNILSNRTVFYCGAYALLATKEIEGNYFLDLTHYRHSLVARAPLLDNFQHTLEADLLKILQNLFPSQSVIGNMLDDQFVKEVLQRLEALHGIRFQTKGNFWFYTR